MKLAHTCTCLKASFITTCQGFLTCVPIWRGSAQKAYLFQASGIIMKELGFHKLRCMKGKGNL